MKSLRVRFSAVLGIAAVAAIALLAATPVFAIPATVTFTSQSGTELFTDLPTQNSDYIAVSVQTNQPIPDAWVKLTAVGNITNVGTGIHQVKYVPGPNVPGSYAGPVASSGLAAGVPKTLFFLVKAAALNNTPQNLTFTLYNGDPSGSGVQQGNPGTLPFIVEGSIAAHANKPNVVVTVPTNPSPGQLGQITFTGATGTVGNGLRLYFTPASQATWLPDQFEIIDSDINIPGYANNDYQDELKIPPADVQKSDHNYTAIYNFIINGPGSAIASPINYIDSGQNVKYVAPDAGSFSVIIPVTCDPPNNVTVTPNPATIPAVTLGSSTAIQTVTFTAAQTGGAAFTITQSGSLPSGVNFLQTSPTTATISGTPTTSGNFTITVLATNTDLTNPAGCQGSVTYNFTVNAEPVANLVEVPTLGGAALTVLALALVGAALLLMRRM